jgi:4-azaleucine resistance transporter AzlC
MKGSAFRAAFERTLPVMAGYLFLGLGFGVLLSRAGYGAGWSFLMSAGIYAGAMQYVTIDLLLVSASFWETALMTLTVNARHLFYGLSMAGAYQNTGKAKPYLAFALTDETFALLSLTEVPQGISAKRYYVCVSALNHLYWVIGSLLGSLAGLLPFDFSGIEFSMTALFAVMLTEQWRRRETRLPVLIGLAAALFCLLLLGPGRFTIPAILLIIGALFLLRRQPAKAGEAQK